MTKIVLTSAAGDAAEEHLATTIDQPVPIDQFERFVGPQTMERLREIYGGRPVPTWGATPGAKGQNEKKWRRIRPGDVALFAAGGRIFLAGTITNSLHNKTLAEQLWGRKEDGQIWEFIYLLDDLRPLSIDRVDFNRAIPGYDDASPFRDFRVLDSSQSAHAIQRFGLRGSRTAA